MKKTILGFSIILILVFIIGCAEEIEETAGEKFPEQETQIVPEEKIVQSAEPAKEPEKPKTETAHWKVLENGWRAVL